MSTLHPRNLHRNGYHFAKLIKAYPPLQLHVIKNPAGEPTISFSDPEAVKALNTALLIEHYGLQHWDIPEGYLCPPVPGRADYLHHLADLLAAGGPLLTGKDIRILDIGTGANLIYAILGQRIYDWSMVGTEADPLALKTAKALIGINPVLQNGIRLRQQKDPGSILEGIIRENDLFHATVCNPPFYASEEEAAEANARKRKNLKLGKVGRTVAGQPAELWTEGGERWFLLQLIRESQLYGQQVGWFTSLVSQKDNLEPLEQALERAAAQELKIIPLVAGQKRVRVLAWRY
ncbi:MAG: 23S rRNA (adenine(1618)-N(6))-methyltransferase RlmF [Bacteroidetes bacterium]|jgi:23S rRNA (adenine1618-N6)-methyltransferase|nr:23S rRNA (adenine(1618)-N(6))-methyltransferase RlmF [Bacteroidota bacterium]